MPAFTEDAKVDGPAFARTIFGSGADWGVAVGSPVITPSKTSVTDQLLGSLSQWGASPSRQLPFGSRRTDAAAIMAALVANAASPAPPPNPCWSLPLLWPLPAPATPTAAATPAPAPQPQPESTYSLWQSRWVLAR
ncbi:hypothetical protein GPECTOR_28g766 [Gonium pectorale]|uniref:Uncharacterized protein n=1 Tax=Gonium pectorale TaxID=33097 RepID=A0A150GET5_GONPE|nr:hypothetical protein GPECTOR_28g766 [Gonium pectorale]|eukprot:KXZ48359.1 hypothetical protein GPECTOR_28g766 [Gonium pectorale]